ncbi:hypothetical protein, partial [Pseudodesulfovibrio senegalensis]|uniref:hypothetical protein n=1 Tax=Pseudodesulfovibrio senegalensis TaxID=1721087 RepID=UPI0019D5F9DF
MAQFYRLLRVKRSFLPSFSLRQQKKKVALEGETFNKDAFAVCYCASAQQRNGQAFRSLGCADAQSDSDTLHQA